MIVNNSEMKRLGQSTAAKMQILFFILFLKARVTRIPVGPETF